MRGAPQLVNVARMLPRSAANGPGERFVLWLQGCGLACAGCWNPDTWSFEPRLMLSVEAIMEQVTATPGIEGVTLTGGEPFAQASALVPLVTRVRAAGLSLVVFTGHELAELGSHAARQVLAEVDVLVTGRFVLAERDLSLPLRGSRNQRVHFMTARYGERDLAAELRVEVHLDSNGGMAVTGFPPDELLGALPAMMPHRGG
jgi:anaerobic ribonucleoside-triphosphate reductase activating protein